MRAAPVGRVAALALLTACSFVPGEQVGDATGNGDAVSGDATTLDAVSDDARAIDARTTDAATIDAAIIDARPVDARPVDAQPIDAQASDGRPACPTGAGGYDTLLGLRRYSLRSIALAYGRAVADCGDDLPGRTHLATFENEVDLDAVMTRLDPGNNATLFVGATCAPTGPTTCAQPASWTWNGTGTVAPSLWGAGEPDNPLTETVSLTRRDMGAWILDSVAVTLTRPYVCECDP